MKNTEDYAVINGGAGNDSIENFGEYALIIGGNGTLIGGTGNNTLTGGEESDTLEGGKGNDILYGGAGDDSLWGGKGNDTLTGGDGDDVFIFRAGDGNDTILDYSSGDMLQILNKKGTSFIDYKKATFSDDTLTLAINGGGNVILKNISDVTAFNINEKILTK